MPSVLHDSQLTPEQRAIVELRPDRHHLVMGPPGSGKTQVLLHRARWLRETYKIPPEGFCVLVYTNVLTYFLRQLWTSSVFPRRTCGPSMIGAQSCGINLSASPSLAHCGPARQVIH